MIKFNVRSIDDKESLVMTLEAIKVVRTEWIQWKDLEMENLRKEDSSLTEKERLSKVLARQENHDFNMRLIVLYADIGSNVDDYLEAVADAEEIREAA